MPIVYNIMMINTPPEHPLEEIAQVFDTTHKEIWGQHPEKIIRLLGIETAEGMRTPLLRKEADCREKCGVAQNLCSGC